jgi:Icc-related predicted phosphoesterase
MSHHLSKDHLFTFAIVTDTHVPEKNAEVIDGYDEDTVKLSVKRLEYVVRELKQLAPDFVVHLGDITHPRPGYPGFKESAEGFHAIFDTLDCPLYLVPGNHDIGQKPFIDEPLHPEMAQRTVNDKTIADYEQHFQPHYYSFEHQDCLFVITNAMIINTGLACEEEQRQWIETLLKENSDRRIFMFSHYPPYLSDRDENNHFDATDEPGRTWLLDLLENHKVEAFYAGHVHNFFFNQHGKTSSYVVPSTCFLRHDFHEFFQVEPGMKQGRHDTGKLGYAVVDVHGSGHLNHIIRSQGRTDDLVDEPVPLPPAHGLVPARGAAGLHLRQPWCDSADIPTPWGLDAFRRKRIRNDYPLLALWEMGVCDLRVPLDDLADAESRSRMAELAALGHRFTAYSYGLPKGTARQALIDHGQILRAWEVVAPTTSAAELFAGISALKGETQVFFNAYRLDKESFSLSHGLEVDDRDLLAELLAHDGAREAIDGMVFGIGWLEAPLPVMVAIQNSAAEFGISAAVHVQFAHRKPLTQDEIERHDANRIAEAVVGALAHEEMTVFLDNFTGIDRGYFFSGGLVDRLYNPLSGAHIVRHLHAALPDGCQIRAISENGNDRLIELSNPEGALLLPATDTGPAAVPPSAPSRKAGRWIDLSSGTIAAELLTGPTLVIPE